MTNEEIARVAHEVNRAYCLALGDTSQVPWDEAPEWQRKSATNGVAFHRANPDAGPDHSHNEWLREKEADGWKFGPVKDAEKKEHPCFVPYSELPTEQKAKDFIFRGVVHALREEIERLQQLATQRGARMQIMREWMLKQIAFMAGVQVTTWWRFEDDHPEARDWFDEDGVPK